MKSTTTRRAMKRMKRRPNVWGFEWHPHCKSSKVRLRRQAREIARRLTALTSSPIVNGLGVKYVFRPSELLEATK
jgi:hypothetical protein